MAHHDPQTTGSDQHGSDKPLTGREDEGGVVTPEEAEPGSQADKAGVTPWTADLEPGEAKPADADVPG